MKTITKLSLVLMISAMVVSCKSKDGEKASTNNAAAEAPISGAEFTVNTSASQMIWEGSKPTGSHTGTINVSEGKLSVENGMISGGEFTIDMNTIESTDLTGDDKAYLEGHLKGSNEKNQDDFFNVATYPTAKFVITKVTKLINNPVNTHLVYGNLTLRDVTKEVGFNANVSLDDKKIVVVTPKFTIDRTDWGVKYGSTKFFDNLKDKFINDDIGLKISITATRNPS